MATETTALDVWSSTTMFQQRAEQHKVSRNTGRALDDLRTNLAELSILVKNDRYDQKDS